VKLREDQEVEEEVLPIRTTKKKKKRSKTGIDAKAPSFSYGGILTEEII
jgi:hypothetical protein